MRLAYPVRNRGDGKQKRTKFTKKEDEALMQGVAKFGVGNWKAIAIEYWDVFEENQRSGANLKDRYRTLQKK